MEKNFYIVREVRDEWSHLTLLAEEVDNDHCVRSLPESAIGTLIIDDVSDIADRLEEFFDPEFSESVMITDSRRDRIFILPQYDVVVTAIIAQDRRAMRIIRIDPALIFPGFGSYSIRPMLFGSGFLAAIRINADQQRDWQDIFLRVMLSA